VTADEYRAAIKSLGLTPMKPSYNGGTLHQDRDRQPHVIPDPDNLEAVERHDIISMLRFRLGSSG